MNLSRTAVPVSPARATRFARKKTVFRRIPPVYLITLVCAGLFLCFPAVSAKGAAVGLSLCASSLIPALFPFLCLAPLLSDVLSALAAWVSRRCSVDGTQALLWSSFVIGMVAGLPLGAVTVLSHVKAGRIDRACAARFLGVTTVSGPAFLSGYIGKTLLGSVRTGWILYGIQLCVSLILFLREMKKTPHPMSGVMSDAGFRTETRAGAPSLSAAVSHGAGSMLSLCGTVVFFSVVRAFLCAFLPKVPAALLGGLAEITGGIRELVLLCGNGMLAPAVLLPLIAFFVGFGGVSVGMQTANFTAGTGVSMRDYYRQKLLCGAMMAASVWVLSHTGLIAGMPL